MSPSLWQVLIVAAIVLLLFGPKRIPGLGKSLGEAIRGFKKGLNDDDEIDVTPSSDNEQLKDSESASISQTTTKNAHSTPPVKEPKN